MNSSIMSFPIVHGRVPGRMNTPVPVADNDQRSGRSRQAQRAPLHQPLRVLLSNNDGHLAATSIAEPPPRHAQSSHRFQMIIVSDSSVEAVRRVRTEQFTRVRNW
jgi:hypothetical protein